jgi:hypothetical protein
VAILIDAPDRVVIVRNGSVIRLILAEIRAHHQAVMRHAKASGVEIEQWRDHVLPSVTDVFDFARFSYDSVVAEDDHVVAVFTARQPGDDCFGSDT